MRRSLPLVALTLLALLVPGSASAAPSCATAAGTTTCTFAPTGAEDTFTVPAGVTSLQVVAIGASGGTAFIGGASGGRGARVAGALTVTPGATLYVAVGGVPTIGDCYPNTACIGGFNGGGSSRFGGGGGGASDVRTVARAQAGSLESRLLVAAGGGGGGEGGSCDIPDQGGAGGDAGAPGGNGPQCAGTASTGGGAGTQVAGGAGGTPFGQAGSLGQGGNGGLNTGGAGGGGLYGGGGGGNISFPDDQTNPAGGGGGGSSLVPAGGGGSLTTAAATVTISFPAPNSAPVAVGDAYSTDEDTLLTVAAPGVLGNDTDADDDTLTAVDATDPAHGTVELDANGAFRYEPDPGYSGPDSFTYVADDGEAESAPGTVTVTVDPVDDAPACAPVGATTDEDTAVDVAPDCTDAEGAALSYAIVDPPEHGMASVVAGQLRYVPATDVSGPDEFTYRASGGGLDSAAATVSISVDTVNDAPVCAAVSGASALGAAVEVAGACTDVDSASLTLAIATPPRHGTAVVEGGAMRYTPAAGFSGTDTFTYRGGDGQAESAPATVTITVTAAPPAPPAPPASVRGIRVEVPRGVRHSATVIGDEPVVGLDAMRR